MSLELFCSKCGLRLAWESKNNMVMYVQPCEECSNITKQHFGSNLFQESNLEGYADELEHLKMINQDDTTAHEVDEPRDGPAGHDPLKADSPDYRSFWDRKYEAVVNDHDGEVVSKRGDTTNG